MEGFVMEGSEIYRKVMNALDDFCDKPRGNKRKLIAAFKLMDGNYRKLSWIQCRDVHVYMMRYVPTEHRASLEKVLVRVGFRNAFDPSREGVSLFR